VVTLNSWTHRSTWPLGADVWQHAAVSGPKSSSTPAASTSTSQLMSLERSWEAIESFLRSEGERMAATASSFTTTTATAQIKLEATGVFQS